MKNKKQIVAALLPSFVIMIYFIVTAFKTMMKYGDTPGDWHFIVASIAFLSWLFLLAILGYRLSKKLSKQ